MSAGDSVFLLVNPSSYLDSSISFWISYAEADKKAFLTVSADSNGTVSPSSEWNSRT